MYNKLRNIKNIKCKKNNLYYIDEGIPDCGKYPIFQPVFICNSMFEVLLAHYWHIPRLQTYYYGNILLL